MKVSLLGNSSKTEVESANCSCQTSIEEANYGPTYIPGPACRFALFPANRESGRGQETSEDHDEERVGRRRSDQGRVSFFARTGTGGSRTRCPDLPVGRSHLVDAKGHRERDSAGGL